MAKQETSPWIWVGVGCATILMLIVGGCFTMCYMGTRWARDMQESMADPVAREQKVKELLGTDTLPEGYVPALALEFGIPVLFDIELVMLADRPFEEGNPEIHDRGFWYFKLGGRAGVQKRQELLDYVEGRRDSTDIFDQSNMHFDYEEIIEQGRLETEDTEVVYSVRSGRVGMGGGLTEALTTLMLIECPDNSPRLGIWFDRELEARSGDEGADHAGNIREFLGHFDVCPP